MILKGLGEIFHNQMFNQNYYIAQAICEIRYPPELIYFDKRIEIGHELAEEFSDWDFEDKSLIKLFTSRENEFFESSCKRSVIHELDVNSLDDFKNKAERIFKKLTKHFEYEILLRGGMRIKYFIESKLEFEALQDLIYRQFVNQPSIITERIFEEKTPDSRFSFDLESKELKYHFNFGPVQEQEIKAKTDLKRLFPDEERIPKVAIFFDMDTYKENISRTEVSDIMNKGELFSKRKIKSLLELLEGDENT